jgi:hypothetical protein
MRVRKRDKGKERREASEDIRSYTKKQLNKHTDALDVLSCLHWQLEHFFQVFSGFK